MGPGFRGLEGVGVSVLEVGLFWVYRASSLGGF